MEESAAIIAFEAIVDGHEIVAEVKKRDEAKAEYNHAIIEGNTAILLEETKADIFCMKLGQLKAGAGAKVKLTYIMACGDHYYDGKFGWPFPVHHGITMGPDFCCCPTVCQFYL